MKKLFLLSSIMLLMRIAAFSQHLNYKEFDLDGNKEAVSSLALSPDDKTLAIGTAGGKIFLWDVGSKKIERSIDITGYLYGPYITYSGDGKYLLLEQQFYTDWSLNKDRPNRAEVLEVASGKIVLTRAGVHSSALSPDSKTLIVLDGGTVLFLDIATGSEVRKFKPDNATNSVTISPDGSTIAVSQKPVEADLKNIPSIREDKKAIKEALKLREVVKFYDAKTFALKYIANDIFDIVFSMKYSTDGKSLYLFNAPNTKLVAQGGASRKGYIQVVNASDGMVSRTIFSTNAHQPQYRDSRDGKYFASTSIEQKFYVFNSVVVFDKASGSMLKNFKCDFRLGENVHNNRSALEFLPDQKTIAIGYGNKLALWSYLEE